MGFVDALSPALVRTADGRLTITTGTPVTTGDVTAATSIYYTPYIGHQIALYDGAAWNVRTFAEITIALAALTASTPYDVFAYDNAGVVTIELLAWTNTTTRATALTTQNGVLVKTGAVTRRYLGTVFINASGGQTDDTLAKRYVYNATNRVPRALRRQPGSTWTYTTPTIRQTNGSAANQVEVMIGVADAAIDLSLPTMYAANSVGGVGAVVGIGEDSTTAMSADAVGQGYLNMVTATVIYPVGGVRLVKVPAAGWHKYTMLEYSGAGGATTWYSVDPLTISASLGGLTGWVNA